MISPLSLPRVILQFTPLSLALIITILSSSFALSQDTTDTISDDFCRETIPSVALRHLRSGRLSILDAMNEQVNVRYSEYLDPTFGGYALKDNLSPIVDQPKPIAWASPSLANGTRNFVSCKGNTSLFSLSTGADSFIGNNRDFLLGFNLGYSSSSLNVSNHPIPGTSNFSSTNSNANTLNGGGYFAWMSPQYQATFSALIHSNTIKFQPQDSSSSTEIQGIAGFSTQATLGTHFAVNHISTHIAAFIIYENLNIQAFPLSTQSNVIINYEAVDLSNVIPGIRTESGAYYASPLDPYTFYGWKTNINAKRVYPLGGNTWAFRNNTTGKQGTVFLDSEWTEVNLKLTASIRSYHARELFASFGGGVVWGEHSSQKLNGSDFSFEVGAQFLL